MVLRLVGEDETKYNGKKEEIKCRLCKSHKTRVKTNGEPIWIKDIDIEDEWTGQFICYDCYYQKNKTCDICGIAQADKHIPMSMYYDSDIWTGRYICRNCRLRLDRDHKDVDILLDVEKGGGNLFDIVVSTVLNVPTYSIYIVDTKLPFSIIHEYYGIVGIKVSKFRHGHWCFRISDHIFADTYFLIGLGEHLKDIQAVYIIQHGEKLYGSKYKDRCFKIFKNSKRYIEFKVDHGPYNDIYKNIVHKSFVHEEFI